MRIKAPAKINLHLAVGGMRGDGFHVLESVFARIGLCDILDIEAEISEISQMNVSGLGFDGPSTITHAVDAWCARTDLKLDVHVDVKKNIPSGAGLGGGSSDGASTLIALQRMFPEHALDETALLSAAMEIGSDVPFFMYELPCAYVTGRGEFVSRTVDIRDHRISLFMPEGEVSTRGAFRMLDEIERPGFLGREKLERYLADDDFSHFFNDFELIGNNDVLDSLRRISEKRGRFSLLSGSGSCCFVLDDDDIMPDCDVAFHTVTDMPFRGKLI